MSKTNDDTSKLGHATFEDHGALADTELDAVSGGVTHTSFSIQKLVDKATPKGALF